MSLVLGAFLRVWNDALDDAGRQVLKPYALQVLGTAAHDRIERRRAWLAVDWLVRTYLPAWLQLAKLTQDADQIRALPEIASATIAAAMPALRMAENNSAAARGAARDAVWGAVWDAVVLTDAARDVVRYAVRGVDMVDVWDVWAAVRATALDAAGAAVRDAAKKTRRAASRAVAGDAVLKPTVEQLQVSARDLLDRMIAVSA